MLAYGSSKRTLRFSHKNVARNQTFDGLLSELTALSQDVDIPLESVVDEPSHQESLTSPDKLAVEAFTLDHDATTKIRRQVSIPSEAGLQESDISIVSGDGQVITSKRESTMLTGRPKFRLEMDLGAESDGSENEGIRRDGSNTRGELLARVPSQVPGASGRCGANGQFDQMQGRSYTIDVELRGKSYDNAQKMQMHQAQDQRRFHALSMGLPSEGSTGNFRSPPSSDGKRGNLGGGSNNSAKYRGNSSYKNGDLDQSRMAFVTPDYPKRNAEGMVSLGRTPGPDTGAGNLYHPSSEPSAHNSVMVTPELPPRRNTRLILPPPRERRSGSRLGGTYPQGASLDCDEGFMQPGKQSQENMNVEDVYPPELSRIWTFRTFNSIQSALHPIVSRSDRNVVVSAPTGCGKTVILEMAVARLLHESGMKLGNRKVIYISPIKALCQQMLDDWGAKFGAFGIRLAELTSDSTAGPASGSLRDLASADIILTTPEKWDSITRRWKEHAFLVGTVALVLVDEVHTIGEERGATLEVILTRMKAVSRSSEVVSMGLPASRARFIALSATLPNAGDIGAFLGAEVFCFGPEYRPVPLQTHVVGYASGNNPFLFDRSLNKHVPGMISRYAGGKPTLIFCGSKKDTETLAGTLAQGKDYSRAVGSQVVAQYLLRAADEAEDLQLGKLIKRGVAIHNSGLSPSDRGLVERAFLSGSLAVLVATTTLAMGVNLPARLVIIKGTNHYRGPKGYQELPRSAILQMMGRAGRPGYDSAGVAVVMTSQKNKQALERLSTGQEEVESSLQVRLLEALNSEVCQGETIHDVGEAIGWMKSTFYFIRCQRNPGFYGLPTGLTEGSLYGHMQSTCLHGLKKLRAAGVIGMDDDDFGVTPTPHGILFSRFMIRFESMKSITMVSEDHDLKDILDMCAACDELNVPLRRSEKRILNELNKKVRFPPPKKDIVRTPANKALTLIQVALGGLPLEDWTLRGEQTSMLEVAARILGCCAESLAADGRNGGLGCATSLRLMRSVRLKMWMDTELGQLRQLPGVGEQMCVRLGTGQIVTLLDLARTPPAKVDTLANRKHPYGYGLRHAALHLLSRALTASVCRSQDERGQEQLQVRVERAFQSTDPFGNRYIEAPDAAHAPPSTGRRRHDMDFQLLVYIDRTPGYKGNEAKTEQEGKGCGVSNATNLSPQTAAPKKGSLLLYRRVSSPGMHHAAIPADAMETNCVIHLWLICSGVCGMDVVDVRMKPSALNECFVGESELRRMWSDESRQAAQRGEANEEGVEDGATRATEREKWSDWEQSEPYPSKPPNNKSQRSQSTRRVSDRNDGEIPAPGGTSKGSKRKSSEGEKVCGRSKFSGGLTESGAGRHKAGHADGGNGKEGWGSPSSLRQMDIASSFKAAEQRSRSESFRKRARAPGLEQTRISSDRSTATNRSTEIRAARSSGLDRGDLGAIGVSEAGDKLGVSPNRTDSTHRQGQVRSDLNTVTPFQQRSAPRTWASRSRRSGVITSAKASSKAGVYSPGSHDLRGLLWQKGSEMSRTTKVGAQYLGISSVGNLRGSAMPPVDSPPCSYPSTPLDDTSHELSLRTDGVKGNRSGSIGDSSAGFNLGETDGAVVDLASFMSAPEGTLEPEFNFDAFAYRPTQDQPNPGSQDVIDLTRSTCSGPAKTAMVEQKRDVPWETPLTAPWSETNAGDARGEIEADELGLSMRTGRKARTWDDVSKQDRSRVGTNRDSRLWSSGGRRGSSSWHQGEKESVLGDQLGTSDDDRNHYRNPDRGGDSFAYVTSDRDVMAMDPSIGSWTTTRRRGSFFDPSDSYRSTSQNPATSNAAVVAERPGGRGQGSPHHLSANRLPTYSSSQVDYVRRSTCGTRCAEDNAPLDSATWSIPDSPLAISASRLSSTTLNSPITTSSEVALTSSAVEQLPEHSPGSAVRSYGSRISKSFAVRMERSAPNPAQPISASSTRTWKPSQPAASAVHIYSAHVGRGGAGRERMSARPATVDEVLSAVSQHKVGDNLTSPGVPHREAKTAQVEARTNAELLPGIMDNCPEDACVSSAGLSTTAAADECAEVTKVQSGSTPFQQTTPPTVPNLGRLDDKRSLAEGKKGMDRSINNSSRAHVRASTEHRPMDAEDVDIMTGNGAEEGEGNTGDGGIVKKLDFHDLFV